MLYKIGIWEKSYSQFAIRNSQRDQHHRWVQCPVQMNFQFLTSSWIFYRLMASFTNMHIDLRFIYFSIAGKCLQIEHSESNFWTNSNDIIWQLTLKFNHKCYLWWRKGIFGQNWLGIRSDVETTRGTNEN